MEEKQKKFQVKVLKLFLSMKNICIVATKKIDKDLWCDEVFYVRKFEIFIPSPLNKLSQDQEFLDNRLLN